MEEYTGRTGKKYVLGGHGLVRAEELRLQAVMKGIEAQEKEVKPKEYKKGNTFSVVNTKPKTPLPEKVRIKGAWSPEYTEIIKYLIELAEAINKIGDYLKERE